MASVTENEENSEPNEPIDGAAENAESGKYVSPIFKEIAKINGEINRMSYTELIGKMKSLNLDCRGKKDVLKKRLKSYCKRKELNLANVKDPNGVSNFHKHLVIIDYEATCDIGQPYNYKHEIIEFPAILLRTKDRAILSEFHSYVKPVLNPRLSTFCTSLTGITQDIVDKASTFPDVLLKFEAWLQKNNLTKEGKSFTVVADGPWDMGRFLVMQCELSKIPFPRWATQWINIRKSYSNFYDTKRICLKDMLLRLGMRFEGQPHRGIDDAKNIARIVIMLLKDGANLRVNEKLVEKASKGTLNVVNVTKMEFEDSYLGKKPRKSKPKPKDTNQKTTENNTEVYFDYFANLDPPIELPQSNRLKTGRTFDPFANMTDSTGIYDDYISNSTKNKSNSQSSLRKSSKRVDSAELCSSNAINFVVDKCADVTVNSMGHTCLTN